MLSEAQTTRNKILVYIFGNNNRFSFAFNYILGFPFSLVTGMMHFSLCGFVQSHEKVL